MINCLLIGYGKIAQIHSKYLSLNKNIRWYWYDPFIENRDKQNNRIQSLENLDIFDKIFILTPENTHYQIYQKIKPNYNKDIFIEKPAIISENESDILDDPKVFVGLVERFNPAISTLKSTIDIDKIINIDFSRCCVTKDSSNSSIVEDISIHDLDLFFYITNILLESINTSILTIDNTVSLELKHNKLFARFLWSKDTFYKERKIIVRQKDCTYIADLQEQNVIRYFNNNLQQTIAESLFVEKGSPIYNEHQKFLSDDHGHIVGKRSHKLLLKLLNDQS